MYHNNRHQRAIKMSDTMSCDESSHQVLPSECVSFPVSSSTVPVRAAPLDKENQRSRLTFDERTAHPSSALKGRRTVIAQSSSLATPSSSSETPRSSPLGTSRVLRKHAQLRLSQQSKTPGSARRCRLLETGAVRLTSALNAQLSFSSSSRMPIDRSHLKATTSPCALQQQRGTREDVTVAPVRGKEEAREGLVASPREEDQDIIMNDAYHSNSYDAINYSYSTASENSFNTTSSSLEEHLHDLLHSAQQQQQLPNENGRRNCTNPVAWTLLNPTNTDQDIEEDWSYLQERDTDYYRGGSLDEEEDSFQTIATTSPALVRALPPDHATKPLAQRPFSSSEFISLSSDY
jgi:hypothetical protein